jgi:hypothetical protein
MKNNKNKKSSVDEKNILKLKKNKTNAPKEDQKFLKEFNDFYSEENLTVSQIATKYLKNLKQKLLQQNGLIFFNFLNLIF